MTVLVDTSAIVTMFDRSDPRRALAIDTFDTLLDGELMTHNYVLAEATAVLGRRFGMDAVRTFAFSVEPAFDVVWIGEPRHRAALARHLMAGRRQASLVDHVSFEVMRDRGIETAFAFDRDFEAEGFQVVPS